MLLRYLAWRGLHLTILLVAVSVGSFMLARVAPGSFYDTLKLDARVAPETVEHLRARYAPDRSLPVQYAAWLRSTLTGDFGYSLSYNRPVADLLPVRLGRTLLLTASALAITWLVALPLGLWCAAHPGGAMQRMVSAATSVILSIPELLLCLLLLYWAARTRVLPRAGSIVLALLVLVMASIPGIYRHVYSAVRNAAAMPSIEAARTHGIRGRRLWTRYILRGAANPLISLLGTSIGTLASASLLVELLLSWPGMGTLFLDAVSARDIDVVTGVVFSAAVLGALGNLAADLLLYAADPRIRME